ncbi:molybdenum cofactor biosynthesis protein MoaE [Nesterenkonia alba]|uniref:molybdenum cofactor biosynthesis protein MoaE n=1 Tax=Nesterenkonia alba TaxID=515814 RepID=UPI0003B732D5|nr:molybdenum cofactor biosynthesis protein MoaE [Nesterenkonia alba]
MSSEAEQTPAPLNRDGYPADEPFEFPHERVLAATITESPLSTVEAETTAGNERAGAVVVFSGIVRNHDAGQPVTRLDYSAHPSAQQVLTDVATTIAAKHPTVRIYAAHRIGSLQVGDHALVAAVASAHRAEAFEACAELVETIKAEVPIWKKQHFTGGSSEWVGL